MKSAFPLCVSMALLVGCISGPDDPSASPRGASPSSSQPAAATNGVVGAASTQDDPLVKPYGDIDGKTVSEYTLTNANGLVLKVLDYGCIVTELHVPGKDGAPVDVVLGSADLDLYRTNSPYFGAMVGRCANRIANAKFTLDGKEHQLAANNGAHSLHGGEIGFDKVIWRADRKSPGEIVFSYESKDGEEGYPGKLSVRVSYRLTPGNAFAIKTTATTDAPTVCNIAHHTYWNLDGHDAGKNSDHQLKLFCDQYTPVDDTLIPTGEFKGVAGTALDFREFKPMGRDLDAVGGDPVGYDHNFVVRGYDPAKPDSLIDVATVKAAKTGIQMHITANQPGVQFYSGNFMNGHPGKGGASYQQHEAFCLETQLFPDSVNKEGVAGWHSAILRPGQTYSHEMVHTFSAP